MTTSYAIQLMNNTEVLDNWGTLAPLLESSVIGNDISATDMDTGYILRALLDDEAVIFACRRNGDIVFVIAFQFAEANGHKCANLIAMGGKYLIKFKALYWEPILEWLRAGGVKFLDTMVPDERAQLYLTKFGFDKSCTILRKELLHG